MTILYTDSKSIRNKKYIDTHTPLSMLYYQYVEFMQEYFHIPFVLDIHHKMYIHNNIFGVFLLLINK